MSKISNTNTNIQQIIFPAGYELRKIKKKKKKGSGNRRKKALAELKNILSQYDAILNEAEEKKIKIPSELGELPVNVNDINTISEIESLTAELRERIGEIEKILSTETRQQRAISLFEMPQRAGVVPQPIPVMPQTFIPPNPPPRTPAERGDPPDKKTTTTTGDKSTTEADLERIQKEIMGKLTADQRAEAEKKLAELKEKAKQEKAGADKEAQDKMGKEDRVVPTKEKYPIDNFKFRSQTPTEEDRKILGEKFVEPVIDATRGEPDSGVGLYDKFRRVRNWMSKLKKKLAQDPENPDAYYLDANEAKQQKKERDTIRTEFEYYIGKLDDKQAQSINDIPALRKMNQSIEQILTQPVQLTAQEEMEALKGRKDIQVLILDPMRKDEPLTPVKKEEKEKSPPTPSTDTDTDSDVEAGAGAIEEQVELMPMKRTPEELETFNELMNNYVNNEGRNWSKKVKAKLRELLKSIKAGENFLEASNMNYKKQFKGDIDTEIATLNSLTGTPAKVKEERKRKVLQYLQLFNKVKGDNPIWIKVKKHTKVKIPNPQKSPVKAEFM